jgi:hypothetical protein
MIVRYSGRLHQRIFMLSDILIARQMQYWEIIADNLSASGWSWGGVSTIA